MLQQTDFKLINPQTGSLAFRLYLSEEDKLFNNIQRLEYYTIIWIKEGEGKLHSDFFAYEFENNSLMGFSPYQPFQMKTEKKIYAIVIQFHPDFFCIHKHHKEVACDGVLFNNIYDAPLFKIDHDSINKFSTLIEQMKDELHQTELAQYDSIISYLKLFLISASRLKITAMSNAYQTNDLDDEPFILKTLKKYIEEHFRTKHSVSEYAELLSITPKALGKITKSHFNKTISELISERIIIEAKRELYLTNKTVKEIAFELGYKDEYYFSRFFKKNAEVSPQKYRETVGFGRSEVA